MSCIAVPTLSRSCSRYAQPLSLQALRYLHTSRPYLQDAVKPSVKLIATLRKSRPVPMSLAKEALTACNNDMKLAEEYLDKHLSSSAAKSAKLSGRTTNEGVIAVSILSGKRVGMVQLGCETDFVARNEVFVKTASGIASTAAFLDIPMEFEPHQPTLGADPILTFPVSALSSAPVISLPSSSSREEGDPAPISSSEPQTVQQSLNAALGTTGENLRLLRAVTFAAPFPSSKDVRFVPGCYAHGGKSDADGRVGAVLVLGVTSLDSDKPIATLIHGPGGQDLEQSLLKLARTIARQIVGFPTKVISRKSGKEAVEEGEALMDQPFMMMGEERRVGEVLAEWGKERGIKVQVTGFRRWAVGDAIASGTVEESSS
ncbi:elongation factor TS-domain-containing protein [Kockovaella imperatae]|uniref:Elongation factor Ts, mitochondrial n=1 Tax=Kockovaella imperatae TaxID=4999 RepID=A0A1Y1UDA6_9TREE|nr:elongation factor TS-domain-containing protein [Kockovaella imperatae]ORX36038.1 elongation factor TS-domain-containing protein [Kockovaella imperatae]